MSVKTSSVKWMELALSLLQKNQSFQKASKRRKIDKNIIIIWLFYFVTFAYLSYFCKSELARLIHFTILLNILKQVFHYFRKTLYLWRIWQGFQYAFDILSDRVLNMPLMFFYYFKYIKTISFYITAKLSL